MRDHLKTALDQVMRYCKDKKFIIRNLQVTGDAAEQTTYTAVITLRPRKKVPPAEFKEHIREIEGALEMEQLK